MLHSPLTTGYFINKGQHDDENSASSGYWEPHTSSIDFCESNYLLSDMIVEPHNVWSSLFGLSLIGILGIIHGNPLREWRTFLSYFILLVIGLGSACLHASLHWCFQSSDELPMIYLVISGLYSILEVDAPQNEPKYPYLPILLLLLSFVNTVIYYTFQHLYTIFLATFSTMTVMLFFLHVQIAWRLHSESKDEEGTKNSDKNNDIALRFYMWHHIIFSLVDFPIWTLDQFCCVQLLPLYNKLPFPLTGMSLHVVWHFCAGLGAHFFVQFLCACRANAIGMVCNMRYSLGIFPVVVAATAKTNGCTKEA